MAVSVAVGVSVSVGAVVSVAVGVSVNVGVSVAVEEGLGVAVWVNVAVCVGDDVGEGSVADGTNGKVGVAVGTRVKVAVISGTNVGGMNSVGVAVWVVWGTGSAVRDCQRQTKLAKPKQYMHKAVKITRASKSAKNLRSLSSCLYWSKSLLNRVSPHSVLALSLGNLITFWVACQTICMRTFAAFCTMVQIPDLTRSNMHLKW